MNSSGETQSVVGRPLRVSQFVVEVVDGPDSGTHATSVEGKLVVGTAQDAVLKLHDPTVSRYHVEFDAQPEGVHIRDLGSRNGTRLQGASVRELIAEQDLRLVIGRTQIQLKLGATHELTVPSEQSFGRLLGRSLAMRRVYSVLARSAPTTIPVLITGESGTGKELCAWSLHEASPRAGAPFEVVDCSALPTALVENELFGHERGAFTGATNDQPGAFERADGGTLFLDELGELPLEVQPKLLRVLGEGTFRRVGGRVARKVNVRVIAATNRDLRRMVNDGGFRADLFYRLAVVQVHMPPLRERAEDIAFVGRTLLDTIAKEREISRPLPEEEPVWEKLAQHSWPGNLREFRNHLEQWIILRSPALLDASPMSELIRTDTSEIDHLSTLPLRDARNVIVERFERAYLKQVMDRCSRNLSAVARSAGVDRVTIYRMLERYGMHPSERKDVPGE